MKVDPARLSSLVSESGTGTGIWVRALHDDRWDSYDIAALDKKSLLAWLKSRGGDNPFAEDLVGQLLGHGPLHDRTESVSAPS